ncbi:MAG: universal stress protein [Blastocatellia bacterium]
MNILLAIDHSVSSETAVSEVIARPWPSPTKVCVLNVVEPPAVMVIPSLVQTATEAAQALVRNAADRLAGRGLETSTHVIQDNPRSGIVEYAGLWGADLIVVGSHGQSAITRLLIGSVAQAAVRHAPCSVEVVRMTIYDKPADARAMKILLATDGSEFSVAAARSVAERPWPEGSTVRVISVAEVTTPAFETWYVDPRMMESLREGATTRARDAALAAEKIVGETGLNVSKEVLTGLAREAIIDEAKDWGADLVVVGSHGLRGIARLLIGSVAEAVAVHTHCSVEVIRERVTRKQ